MIRNVHTVEVPGMGYPAGSATAKMFYGALLDQKVYWEHTLATESPEGVVMFDLPNRAADTNGRELGSQAVHCLIRCPFPRNPKSAQVSCRGDLHELDRAGVC